MVLCGPSFGPISETLRGSRVDSPRPLLISPMADRRGRRHTFGRQLHGCHRRSRAARRRVTAARGARSSTFSPARAILPATLVGIRGRRSLRRATKTTGNAPGIYSMLNTVPSAVLTVSTPLIIVGGIRILDPRLMLHVNVPSSRFNE